MFEILKNSPLFTGLDNYEVDSLINNTLHQIKHFSSTEVLAFSGERVEKAMVLLEGKLQGEIIDFAGNSLKIEEIEPPQMVAAAFLYGPQSVFPVNLSALENGKMLVIYKKDFTKMLSDDPRVLNNYLNIVSGKAQFLSRKITFLSFKTIREKIAYYLLQNVNKGTNIVQINQTQKGLAELFGVARPSLARTISEMESDRLILWERTKVSIVNLKALQLVLGK